MQQAHPVRSGIPEPLKSNLTASGERKVYPRDSVRLFESPLLERFTHVHPAVPAILWVPVIGVLIYRSLTIHGNSGIEFAGYGLLGLFVWSLVEYGLHRFVFHYPAKSAFGNRLVYLVHGLHHEDPADPTRLVMPPLPALIYAAIFFPAFRLVVGASHVEAFFAFFMVGYLAYDYIHFFVHHFTPRTRVGRYLKRYHLMHHFSNYESKWGVSNPLWDFVFGTVEPKGSNKGEPKGVKKGVSRNASRTTVA